MNITNSTMWPNASTDQPGARNGLQPRQMLYIILVLLSIIGLVCHAHHTWKVIRDLENGLVTMYQWVVIGAGLLFFLEAVVTGVAGIVLDSSPILSVTLISLLIACMALVLSDCRHAQGYIPYVTAWLKSKKEKKQDWV
ncbi:uncharacterized protein LOC135463140 [Liolophura sinensis]|uniref:uncharacterized protein LOC135463140 n=1 Tax=Liolophura sinensis TaxID=3198878 RepID=UPI00315924FE